MKGRSSWWALVGLVALAAAAYGQTTLFDIVWDDHALLLENPVLQDRVMWREVFTSSNYLDQTLGAGRMYRPLLIMSLAADRAVWGMHPGGFHVSSALAHLAIVLLLYRLTLRLSGSCAIGFLAGALLAVHPSAVEAVAWVTARMDVFVALGMIGVLLLLEGCLSPGGGMRLAGALLCFAFALGSKETAVVIPALVTWTAWVYPEWFAGPGKATRRMAIAGRVVPFWVALGLYGTLRWTVVGSLTSGTPLRRIDPLVQVPRALVALATYGKMTLIPGPATGYIRIEPPTGPGDGRLLLGIAMVGLILAGLLWSRRLHPPSAVALGWYAAALVPTSNLLPVYVAHEVYVAERSLYPALVGWCLFVAVGAYALQGAAGGRLGRIPSLLRLVSGGVVATFLVVTIVKVGMWRNDVTLWTASTISDPGSAFARYNLATALARAGRLDEAHATLQETEALFPTDSRVAYVGGWIAELRNDPREAQREYERAISLGLRLGTAYRQAAVLAGRLREWDRSGRWFAEAAQRFPMEAWPHVGLGWYRAREGRADLARAHLERAARLEPNAPEREWFLGQLYATEGRAAEALRAYHAALALDSSYLPARMELASIADQEGRVEEAIALWRRIAADLPAGTHRNVALAEVRRLGTRTPRGSADSTP